MQPEAGERWSEGVALLGQHKNPIEQHQQHKCGLVEVGRNTSGVSKNRIRIGILKEKTWLADSLVLGRVEPVLECLQLSFGWVKCNRLKDGRLCIGFRKGEPFYRHENGLSRAEKKNKEDQCQYSNAPKRVRFLIASVRPSIRLSNVILLILPVEV